MSDLALYSHYFPAGKKVGVVIPLPNADVFKDWAIIHEIDEDLVSLQLSRDVLPVNVTLRYGQILELRGGSEESGYCCRAIVVSEGDAHELLLRLVGEVVSDELREFYRIDAFLPIKYFVSSEQNIEILHKQWEARQARRQHPESERGDHRWGAELQLEGAKLPDERLHESLESGEGEMNPRHRTSAKALASWDATIPLAANISGGGLRIITQQGFENGEYMLLEILVPTPQRVVDVIGRVVLANRGYSSGNNSEYFNVGVRFMYLDERDRDAIVNYISTIQLKRIRQLRERYLYRKAEEIDEPLDQSEIPGVRRTLIRKLSFLFVVALVALLGNYFWRYTVEHPKGEIQRIFEESIDKYKDQFK